MDSVAGRISGKASKRSGRSVKTAFEEVFKAMVRALESSVAAEGDAKRERAPAIAALCIGGVVVARAMRSEAGADALREACMAIAMEIGGFEMRGAGDGARTNRRRDKVARESRVRD